MNKKSVLLTALVIAGFAVTSLAQTVPNYVPSNGLQGWWPFNGNAIDESVNTNDGTVNGATLTADRFGNANSAYSFNNNPNEYITTNYFGISGGGSRTISFWIKTNSSNIMHPVNYGGYQTASSSNAGTFFQCSFNYGGIGVNANTGYSAITYQCPTFVINNQWSHYAWVFDSIPNATTQSIKIYQNGVLLTNVINNLNQTATLYTNVGVNPLLFGKDYGGFHPFFGSLDDIGFWKRALTQQEITGLYNGNLCFQTITVTDTLLINTNLTGFNPVTYQNTIKIWPNPTNDHITIDNGNLANLTGHQIKISNALGQQVFQSAITQQQFYVDMSTWGGNGIYFVNLINAQGVTIETRKIVLQ